MLNLPTKKPHNPRVSFTYLKQQQQRSHSQQTPKTYHRNTPQGLHIKRQVQISTKNQHSVSFSLSFEEQTLKKEGWEVQARTERKQVGRKVETQVPEAINRAENRMPDSEKMNEVHLLRQEIRYIRKKLLDSENNEKDLLLEFQLFKANREIETPSTLTTRQEQPEQPKMTKKEQLQRIWRDYEQQTKELCQMKQLFRAEKYRVLDLERSLNEAKRQNDSLKTSNKEQFILQNLSYQNDRLNSLFERQKEGRLNAEEELRKLKVEHENVQEQIQQLQKLLESKNKDINFLNQQSYQLDMEIQKRLRQIQHLNNQSAESNKKHRSQLSSHQQIVHALQANIERLALTVEQQRTKYKCMLQEVSKDALLVNYLKSTLEKDISSSIEPAERDKDIISEYEIELSRLREENKQYKQTIRRITQNEEALADQLTFLREESVNRDELEEKYRQKEEAWLKELNALRETEESERKKHAAEKQQLQSRLLQFSAKYQDKADMHIKHFNNVINNIQPSTQVNSLNLDLYSSQQLLPSPPASQQSIRAHSLTHQEVSQYIQLIKNQPDNNEQHLKLLQDFQDLQQQMAFLKKSLEQTIEDTRQRYEKQLRDSQKKYERHLHRYTQQIEELMQQMSLIKGQASQRGSQVEIIQEDPELQDLCQQQEEKEYDNNRVERDLMLHADEHSAFFADPSGSETPVKELMRLTTPTSQNEEINYMLQDIMDLESKVHSYIHNFNKRRSSRPEQQKSD